MDDPLQSMDDINALGFSDLFMGPGVDPPPAQR
jgi:hypothetical protein